MIGKRQIVLAAVIALLLEASLLLAMSWGMGMSGPGSEEAVVEPEEPSQTDEVVVLNPIMPMEPVAPVPLEPLKRPEEKLSFMVVETSDDQNLGKPERPSGLISDRATRAAGDAAAPREGLPERPNIAGIAAPGFDLADQNFQDGADEAGGSGGTPGQPADEPGQDPAAVAGQPEERPEKPVEKPLEKSEEKPAEPVAREAALELLELPGDMPRIDVQRPEEMLRERKDEENVADEASVQSRPPAGTGGSGEKGFQSQKIRRAMEGTISQQGPASLDLEDTALGRYLRKVSKVIERDWQRACRQNRDVIQPGFLRVNFTVGPDGKVSGVRAVEARDGGEASKWFTMNSVKGAELPAIPKDVVEVLEAGQLEVNFNFLFF